MLDTYQHLPEFINPIALSVGFLNVRWYSLGYLVAFATIYGLLRYRIKRGEFDISKFLISKSEFLNKSQIQNPKSKNFLNIFFLYGIVGLLIGARLGYVLFYNFSYYIRNPLEIIWPFSSNGNFVGISGMSYFGGLVGIIVASLIYARNHKINFWKLADFVVPAIPAGYFFGRLGNFLNGELYGRATQKWWGMYFPSDPGNLRHPSQLYEAFFEGIVLFLILWFLRNRWSNLLKLKKTKVDIYCDSNKCQLGGGILFSVYLFGYGFFRFSIEFFREPDPQIGQIFNFLTLGQIFSLIMLLFSGYLFFRLSKKKECI